ncbi:MAG: outer membrane protein assembly factor BamA [Opitutales bacterium]|nr:outer membrane protein assembly factor BamA [Opitutales bacterium]
MRFPHYALLLLFCFVATGTIQAQYAQQNVSPTINEIKIDFGQLQNVSREVIMAHLQVREGMEYDQLLVDRSVRSLYGTGLFDFIQAELVELSPTKVDIVFNVQSKYRIESVRFSGNERYSRSKLIAKSEKPLMPGGVLDELSIRKAADKMRDFYREKGYTDAKVDYKIDRNPSTGLGAVTFEISEGARMRISRIAFEGNEEITSKQLRKQMETSRYKWWWSWLSGSGRMDEEKLAEDLKKIRTFYKDKGYLDVELNDDDVKVSDNGGGDIVLTIPIREGRQYFVGDITIEGEEVFPEMFITRALKMIPGDPFSPTKLDEDCTAIEEMYGNVGRLEARVRAERVPNLETDNIDIRYQITEGEEYKIETVNIEGNTKTKSVVILRELAMRPGQIFNTTWMKASEARLKNTRFFDDVSVTEESTNIPGRKNMKVTVHEAPTATFQFGVGFSSVEEATAFFEYAQANFDLFNWRSFFQGGGQKFRVRVSVGSYSSEAIISFEEPYFMQQRLGLGFELYRTEAEYNSDYYDEIRTGLNIYARKRLFERFEGRLTYTLENVEIDMVSSGSSPVYELEAGERLVSKLGLMIQRDTRNDLLFTTAGSRLQLNTEVAGLGGDTQYLKVESRNALFLPTFETGEQTVAILLRAGTVWSMESDLYYQGVNYNVPFFDRFFMGGPQSLRGFEHREVGPRDPVSLEPVGGNTYGFASLEYTIKVAEQFRIAMFYDWGFVNSETADFDPVNYNDDWGFGIRLLVMNNPLSLDYALPINSDDYNDEGGQFNFSFGTRF